MPFFSIIVPIYKVEDYLSQCIESVLSQDFIDFELILVDDGSPDNCPIICDEYSYKDNRIKTIHKKNGGLVSARKAGAIIASGNYIVCLDGDDWLDKNYLQSFYLIIKEYNPDIVCCGAHFQFKNKSIDYYYKRMSGFLSKSDIVNSIFPELIQAVDASYFPPSLWGKAFKRELYVDQQLKVPDGLKIGEDGACVIPLIYICKSMYILRDCLYNYRQNDFSMTKSHKVFDINGPYLIQNHLSSCIDLSKHGFDDQLNRKIVHDLFIVITSQFYRNDKYRIICNDIKEYLKKKEYCNAINSARFKGSKKAKMMLFALRRRKFGLIKLYSMIK